MTDQIKFLVDSNTKKKFRVKVAKHDETITGVLTSCMDAYLCNPEATMDALKKIKK